MSGSGPGIGRTGRAIHVVRGFAASLILMGTAAPALAAPSNAGSPPGPSACALRSGFVFLRDLVFSSAITAAPGKSVALNRLKRAVRAEASDARATAYDPSSGRIDCAATLRLWLPAQGRAYFGGSESISAAVQFSAEPGENGEGFSVVTRGLAPLAAQIVAAARRFPEIPDFGAEDSPTVAATPGALAVATTPPLRAAVAGFDCNRAQSRVEDMICASDALADRDRWMSQQYFARRAGLAPSQRQKLLSAQRNFLRLRDRCGTEECLVGLYLARRRSWTMTESCRESVERTFLLRRC